MASITQFPARGKVVSVADDHVVFIPSATNYELKLQTPRRWSGVVQSPVNVLIRVRARKLYTVPSGGNFISPIFGPPRIVQGRIKHLDDRQMVVQAGCPVVVDLPSGPDTRDLNNGPLAVGQLVNVVCLPGASVEAVDDSPATQTVSGGTGSKVVSTAG